MLVFAGLCLAGAEKADAKQAVFRQYGVDDGLSQSQIRAIVQDRDGYVWLGTEYGLSRFDGREFKTYTVEDGLRSNRFSAGIVDMRGRLWFGHPMGGLTRFDGDRWEAFDEPEGTYGAEVLDLLEDRWGRMWIATYGDGLQRFDPELGLQRISDPGLPGDWVFTLLKSDNRLFAGTRAGLYSLPLGPSVEPGASPEACFRIESPDVPVISSAVDSWGTIWIGTVDGSIYARPREERSSIDWRGPFGVEHGLSDRPVYDITPVSQGAEEQIWVSTLGGGVIRFRPDLANEVICDPVTYTLRDGLAVNDVVSAMEDREGNLWFGTDGQGVSLYHGSPFTAYLHTPNPKLSAIWAIAEDDEGRFWFGTQAGLVRYTPSKLSESGAETVVYSTETGLPDDSIRDIHIDDDGYLWLATDSEGLVRFDPRDESIFVVTEDDGLPSNQLLALAPGEEDDLWIGFYEGGVARYTPPFVFDPSDSIMGTTQSYRLMEGSFDTSVYEVFRDRHGGIWLATSDLGLGEFVSADAVGDSGCFTFHAEAAGLEHLSLNGIDEDSKGRIWIATDDGGVYSFDRGLFTNVVGGSRIAEELVYLLAIGCDDRVLVGTNKGLYRYDDYPGQFTHFGTEDGFAGIETNVHATFEDSEHQLWFGTICGAFRYNAAADRENLVAPKIHLTGMRVEYEPVEMRQDLVLEYDRNHVAFEFVGISTRAPEGVRYRYKLDGFDPGWLDLTTDNDATYSNLPHGEYTFLVEALNSDGIASLRPESIHFTIKAPFWETLWFRLLAVISGIVLVRWVARRKIRGVERTNRELEAKVVERTRALVDREEHLEKTNRALEQAVIDARQAAAAKSAFLATMSHEIRTPMNGVLGMAELLIASELTSDQQHCAELIQDSGSTLLSLINDVLDLSKIEAGGTIIEETDFDCAELVVSILSLMAPKAAEKGIEIGCSIDPCIPLSLIGDPHRLRQILMNLIGNAIKFTDEGQVIVRVRAEWGGGPERVGLCFEVVDSGIGIGEETLHTVFEPFRQEDSSFTRRYGGTGLGLTICQRLVTCMGGEIGVDSTRERGSLFWFRVELGGGALVATRPLPPETVVLIIDSNHVMRMLLRDQLDQLGATVRTAASATEALRMNDHCDWILIDNREGISWLASTVAKLRSHFAHRHARLAIMVPLGEELCAGLEPCRALQKPVAPGGLLAMLRPDGGQAASTRPEDQMAEESEPAWTGARVLVVDDNLINLKVAERMLENLRCDVDSVESGGEAIAAIEEGDYDIVFMDCQMPEIDGFEATERIRRMEGGDRFPIVALTANAMEGDRELCLAAGMNDYLAKPIDRRRLAEMLTRYLVTRSNAPLVGESDL